MTRLNLLSTLLFIFASLGFSFSALAEEESTAIRFPIEELPSEVITPNVDSPRAVESPLITFKNKSEIQLQVASQLDEAFYSGLLLGARYNYHISELYFFGVSGDTKMSGTSPNANALSQVRPENVDFDRAPQLNWRASVDAGYRLIYGKISFSKDYVRPISVYAEGDLGMGSYDGKTLPYVNFSLNNQFFFSPKNAVVLTLGLGYVQHPNVLSKDLSSYLTPPDKGSYDDIWSINSELKLAYSHFF